MLQFRRMGLNLAPHPSSTVISTRVLALAGATLSFVACSRPSGPIEIGLAGPVSQPRGVAMVRGAQLAVDQINARGGVGGRRLKLRIVDDSANEDAAARVAQVLYDDPGVVAVVGHLTSDASIVAAQVYGGGVHPVTLISPTASSPDLSGINPYFFRICPSDSSHGMALAKFAFHTLVARRVGIVFISDDYGRGVRKTFASEFGRLGGSVVEADPYVPATPSLEPYLSRMRQRGIDALVLAADRPGAELALRQMRSLGIDWPVIGGDALTGIEATGALAEGIRISSPYLPAQAGEQNAAFVAEYARAYRGERPDHRAASTYDIVNLLARAIKAAGADRRSVRSYLSRVGRGAPAFDGVTGKIAFDDAGNVPSKGVVIGVVRHGNLVAETGE
jgi:branched-chain amino acid transport system substrate-binding protein